MNGRVALWSLLAFCLALGLGRALFQPAPTQSLVINGENSTPEIRNISAPTVPGTSKVIAPKPAVQAMERNFKQVEGGVQNENTRMSTFVSSIYSEGASFQVASHHHEKVSWRPESMEVRRGHEVVGSLGGVSSARARLESAGDSNRVTFLNTYPETDERMYMRTDGGMEHDIILKKRPATLENTEAIAYTGYLSLGYGLTLWDGDKKITGSYTTRNGIQIKNSFGNDQIGKTVGNTLFYLRPPIAWDSAVTLPDGSLDKEKQAGREFNLCETACEYHLDFDDSGCKLSVVVPGTWLKDSKRAYPVTIDPNLGPFGLADGNPPVYVASTGSDTEIPVNASGTKVLLTRICAINPSSQWGAIPMPFPFTFCNQTFQTNANLFVGTPGIATFANIGNNPCFFRNVALPSSNAPLGGNLDPAFFVYWSNMKVSSDPTSGIYFFVDGTAPSRRLVIEWHKMGFITGGTSNDLISFNLVLFECTNKFEYIIGAATEIDPGFATVGMECNPTQFIQYDFNSALSGKFNPQTGRNDPLPPITAGTALTFDISQLSKLNISPTFATGCIPKEVCFSSTQLAVQQNCSDQPALPPTFAIHWQFGDGGEAFTPSPCHTWIKQGNYQVKVDITDSLGISTKGPPITVLVCDVPSVVIGANPQGGTAPLNVDFEARTFNVDPLDPTHPPAQLINFNGDPSWVIERLGANNEPGQSQLLTPLPPPQGPGLLGKTVSFRFDLPGIYRATATLTGTDVSTGLPTSGSGMVFIFVGGSSDTVVNNAIITESKVKVDWKSKTVPGTAKPGNKVPLDQNKDILTMKGYISLPGITTSALAGRIVRVVLNGTDPLIEAPLNANGDAIQGDKSSSIHGNFHISLPSGLFTAGFQRNLFGTLGVTNVTERRLLPAHFRIEISGLFPVNNEAPIIVYDYRSRQFHTGGGDYKFGMHSNDKVIFGANGKNGIAPGFGIPGGLEALVSGGFLVTQAKLVLKGNTVFADIRGLMARFGGDSLRPLPNSNVVVSIGNNFAENLNFSTTPTFKTTGRFPRQRFSFKRDKSLENTGIKTLDWVDIAGGFHVVTNGIPNERVGLNPALAIQAVNFGITITPESGQVFQATVKFDVTKTSDSQFTHSPK